MIRGALANLSFDSVSQVCPKELSSQYWPGGPLDGFLVKGGKKSVFGLRSEQYTELSHMPDAMCYLMPISPITKNPPKREGPTYTRLLPTQTRQLRFYLLISNPGCGAIQCLGQKWSREKARANPEPRRHDRPTAIAADSWRSIGRLCGPWVGVLARACTAGSVAGRGT